MSDATVLCFGDSLTWGYVPRPPTVRMGRYPREQRWTGVMADALGEDVTVLEEGLCGRTTTAVDPLDDRTCGSAHLPALLASHLPLDLVVIMLGTNDAKACFRRSPLDIAAGACHLLGQVAASAGDVGTTYAAPRALLVSPPPLGDVPDPWSALVFDGARATTRALPPLYRAAADFAGASFFDAGSATGTDGVDGVHLGRAGNHDLGTALAVHVRQLLGR